MNITINGLQYDIPTSLLDITLADRVQYDHLYGKYLREHLSKIIESTTGVERELELGEYQCDLACKSVSFFGKISLDVIQNTSLEQVLIIHQECLQALAEENNFASPEFVLQTEILWNNDTWIIAPPELKNSSAITFGEFLDAKQCIKNLLELGNERWESLITLCSIYLRKAGESYSEKLSEENGERYNLMRTLPLAHALHVGFFLNASIHSYTNTSQSSSLQESQASQNSSGTLTLLNG